MRNERQFKLEEVVLRVALLPWWVVIGEIMCLRAEKLSEVIAVCVFLGVFAFICDRLIAWD